MTSGAALCYEVWGQGETPVFRITKEPPSETGVKKPRYLSPFFYGFEFS